MKTLDQIKNEVVAESYFRDGKPMKFSDLWESYPGPNHLIDKVAKKYATEALKEAAERAELKINNGKPPRVDKQSILLLINELK